MKAVAVLVLCAALMAGAFATAADVDTEVHVAAEVDVAADVETEAVAEVDAEAEAEAEAEDESEVEAEADAEAEAEVDAEAVAEVEVEADAEKPRRRSSKVAPRILEKRHFMPKTRIVIVPKGDPRARDGSVPVMLPPVVAAPTLPVAPAPQTPVVPSAGQFPVGPIPTEPTPSVALPTVPTAIVTPIPAGPAPVVPNVPVGAGATVPTARPILKAGTPTSAACAQRRGTCKASSSCTGNFQIVRGICSGPSTITCCVPKAAASKPTTTKPTTTKPTTTKPGSTTTTPASQCPVYANSPESSIKGNGNVMYRVVRIASQHFTGSADNTMTKATACAFARMAQDAARAGIRLTINSGFRTYERQLYFWNCFQTKRCNNGNRAARPGNSNHGRGQALDINTGATSTATYRWMAANASKYGFRRTVSDEPWHWER